MRLRSIALAIFIFFAVAHGISIAAIWLGFSDKYALGAVLDQALSARDTTALFVGTSRIRYGLNPLRFDAETAKQDIHTQSHLLAAPALSFVEMEYLLRSYFSERPCCIKYVFIEPDLGSDGTQRSPNSVRSILFFNLSNSVKAFTYLLEQQEFAPLDLKAPFSLETKLTFLKQILIPLFRHYTNAGIFQSFIDDTHENFQAEHHENGYVRGDSPLRLATSLGSDRARTDHYYTALRRMSEPYSTSHVSDQQFVNFMKLMTFIKSKGAQPVILRPPQFVFSSISASVVARIRAACSDTLPVLDFGRPADNEYLFDPNNRTDYDHLNDSAVQQFSQMVADRFTAVIKTSSASPACLNELAR